MICRVTYALMLVATLAGCTLVDLSGGIERAECAVDADCKTLNERAELGFDECRPFRCTSQHLCERGQLDRDGDGYAAPECAAQLGIPLAQRDCNDDAATGASVHPFAAESCNGRDDDCDLRVDEDLLRSTQTTVLDFASTEPVTSLVFAPSVDRPSVTLGYVPPTAAGLAVYDIAAAGLDSRSVLPLQLPRMFEREPRALSLGLGGLPGARVAIASFVNDTVPRVLVGSLQPPATQLGLSPQIARYGLACARSEACAENAGEPAQPAPTPPSGHFAIASGAGGTLVVYARDLQPTAASACASEQAAPAQPLLANLLSDGAEQLAERSVHASEVALTRSAQTPALIALPSIGSYTLQRFLAAYSAENSELVVEQWSASSANDSITRSAPLLRLPAALGGWHDAQLVLGNRPYGDVVEVGLVAVRGCGADSRVIAARLWAQLRESGDAALFDLDPAFALDETAGYQHAPVIAWNTRQRAWGIAYRDHAGVQLRTLDAGFAPLGEDAQLLSALVTPEANGVLGAGSADALAIVPLPDATSWFAVFHQARLAQSFGLARSALQSCVAQ